METNPKELAAQLRKPEGEFGVKVAQELNNTNKYITAHCYNHMELSPNQSILEIGPGNGVLMQQLLEKEPSLSLVGIDFSKDMIDVANELNGAFVSKETMSFKEASVSSIPFDDNSFHHICTINTLYFWPTPLEDAKEVIRVLKPDGSFTIAIRPKVDLEKLEVTKFGFTYFEQQEVEELLLNAGFKTVETHMEKDPPIEFDGETFVLNSLIIKAYK